MKRPQCDSYIKLFETNVKKKMQRAPAAASGGGPRHGSETLSCRIVCEVNRIKMAVFDSRPAFSRSRRVALLAIAASALLVPGCARRKRIAVTPPAPPPRIGATETGIASWYGYPYHGRRAADGEIYDMEKLTAAHRTLPFGTWVEVTNLSNRKTVTVRITDRGPFVEGRIIDLSRAAARAIDMLGPGTAVVRLTIVAPPRDPPVVNLFAVQVGAYRDRSRAEALRREYEQRYGTARLVFRSGNPALWRVLVGNEQTMDAAAGLLARIQSGGGRAFIVRVDQPMAAAAVPVTNE
jgi:peptidoglycan lytic transglycosylase